MWKINDIITYRTVGLCRIDDITTESFDKTPADYYVLKPLADEKSVIRVPCANSILCEKMRPLLTRSEAEALVEKMPSLSLEWQENDKRRAEYFKGIIESGNRNDIAALIQTIRVKEAQLISNGKKLRASDEALVARAEKLLFSELAHVLNVSEEELFCNV